MSLTPQSPMPMAIYIHWPFCKAKCPYCDFNSHVREGVEQDRWRKALLAELRHFAACVPDRSVQSIFFGGGTPSLMAPQTASALIEEIHRLFRVAGDVEITLEANPTSTEASAFRAFREAGVGRVSLGLQALNDADLKFLGRQHSATEALEALAIARDIFSRHSFDLIYARPGQNVAAWEKELSQALTYSNGHLSLYQLTIEEGTAFHHAYHRQKQFTLPSEDEAAEMYELTQALCEAHGLPAYEVSNHAAPGQESRHNLAYWRGYDYLGIGPGAHGRITDAHGERVATLTLKSPERWLESVEKHGHGLESETPLSRQEVTEERVMMGLRIRDGIEVASFHRQTGRSVDEALNARALALMLDKGLLTRSETHLAATPKGRLLLTRIAGELVS